MKCVKKLVCVVVTALCITPIFALSVRDNLISTSLVESQDNITTTMRSLENIYRFAERNFIYDIDYNKVYEAMASAMLDAFGDQWTMYIDSEESKAFKEGRVGDFGGIGIYLTKSPVSKQDYNDPKTLYVVIQGTMDGGPAMKAGLRSGDLIIKINDEDVVKMSAFEASNNVKGTPGTTVKLTIKRQDSTFDVTLKREIIKTPTTSSTILENNIGYLKINEFTTHTHEQVKEELDKLKNTDALIIDLRYNGGGDVFSCTETAKLFLQGYKTIVSAEGKNRAMNQVYTTSIINPYYNPLSPIVILTNGSTASASEILTGALRDNGRATVIGSKTYGKGVMQISSAFGEGIVNVTAAEYKTPNGDKVNEIGISPDIEVLDPVYDTAEHLDDKTAEILKKFSEDEIAKKFVDEHTEFTDENIKLFVDTYKDEYQLEDYILTSFVVYEYVNRMDSDKRPVALPKYDVQLKEAVKFLESEIN